MIIYGAGMAGLLAAKILYRHNPVVYEAAPSLPNNHNALLRFRSNVVSEITGIAFKKVWVQKYILDESFNLKEKADIKDQNCYSHKVSGAVSGRSITNLAPGERYIAPKDFISKMAEGLNIEYNRPLTKLLTKEQSCGESIISTIPMNVMMDIAEWKEKPEFKYYEISTITAEIKDPTIDVYQTIYYPYENVPAYRASITGDKLIIEIVHDNAYNFEDCSEIDLDLSLRTYLMHFVGSKIAGSAKLSDIKWKKQKYGKLVNSTGEIGKEFIMALTDIYNVYSVGRFATWRQLLLDDIADDIKKINNMISGRDHYRQRLAL